MYFEYGSQSVGGQAFSLAESPGGVFYFQDCLGTFGSVPFNLDQWYYLAVVENANGTQSFYVNGILEATGALSINTAPNSAMTVGGIMQNAGSGLLPAYYVNANIEQVHVYNTALTTGQITQDMQATVPEPSWLACMLGALMEVGLLTRKRLHRC